MTSLRSRNLQRLGICLLLVIVVSSVGVVRGSSLPVPIRAEEIDGDRLEPGDILLVDIYDGWSQGGYWDHMAVYSDDPYPGVVEATYNAGIAYTSLPAFLERDLPAEVSVRRLKDIPGREESIRRAVEYALAQVGQPFDYTATATLPLKINERNLHCSEVVWRSYKAGGIDLDSNGGLLVYPDDIYFSPKLELP
jgi:uncharacterized protein YycO